MAWPTGPARALNLFLTTSHSPVSLHRAPSYTSIPCGCGGVRCARGTAVCARARTRVFQGQLQCYKIRNTLVECYEIRNTLVQCFRSTYYSVSALKFVNFSTNLNGRMGYIPRGGLSPPPPSRVHHPGEVGGEAEGGQHLPHLLLGGPGEVIHTSYESRSARKGCEYDSYEVRLLTSCHLSECAELASN